MFVGDIPGDPQEPVSYALTPDPYTALQQVWAPLEPSSARRSEMDSGDFTVYEHELYESKGLGAVLTPGIPWVEHAELAPGFAQGTTRHSLAYLWVVADPQITDEESPIRMDGYELLYRPHGQLTPHTFEAHVRTAERISALSGRPFDFALLAGDLTDSAQHNELHWMLTALNGGVIDPDSGMDNDPVVGPGNDYNDPFLSAGLSAPWYAALGNHDVVHLGGFGVVDDDLRAAAAADHLHTGHVFNDFGWPGFVAGDSPTHQVVLSPDITTPPDAERAPLFQAELLQALHDADGLPSGHGLTQGDVDNGVGYFAVHPMSGKPVKLIVLDTTNDQETMLNEAQRGSMDAVQYGWLQQELLLAESLDEVVILVSHHRLEDFSELSEVDPDDLKALFSNTPNVVLHITGHGHADTKRLQTVGGSRGYWELMTASTIDFPMQSRAVELVYENSGFISIYVTNFDHNSPAGTPADRARQLAAGKLAFGASGFDGDTVTFWDNEVVSQNLLLRVAISASVDANLALPQHAWPLAIESIDTLASF